MPPHEALARPNNKPPTIAFIIAILGLCFIAEISKYKAKSAKNRPRGSDLNHPKLPRWIIAGVKAINKAENRPAVVPPNALTSAKTTIVVNDPTTTGNIIVKSKIELFPPKIL